MKWLPHLATALVLVLFVSSEACPQTSSNTIKIEQVWARATPSGAQTGAAYMTLINNGASADRLVSASTPVADQIQFHSRQRTTACRACARYTTWNCHLEEKSSSSRATCT